MKSKLIMLGCGSSVGVPRIDGYWGKCKKIKKNYRTRCSALIQKNNINILIDTSPDLKEQLLRHKIRNIDFVLYTHEHADQTHGINELRPFFWKNKRKINIYGNSHTISILKKRFNYCFKSMNGYRPILKSNVIKKNKFDLLKNNNKINFTTVTALHGYINSLGYIFEKTAYISDCNGLSNKALRKLKNLKYLIIDCLKIKKHNSHFNLREAILISKLIKPKKTILTNLHHDLDYNYLLHNLPTNVIPAYDGLELIL